MSPRLFDLASRLRAVRPGLARLPPPPEDAPPTMAALVAGRNPVDIEASAQTLDLDRDVHIPGKYQHLFKATSRDEDAERAQAQAQAQAAQQSTRLRVIAPPRSHLTDASAPPPSQFQLRVEGRKRERIESLLTMVRDTPHFGKGLKPHLWDVNRTALSKDEKKCVVYWTLTDAGRASASKHQAAVDAVAEILEQNRALVQKTMGKMAKGWHGSSQPSVRFLPQIEFRFDKLDQDYSQLETIFAKIERELGSTE
ncbi:hypothetical protein HK105_205061 [Polyrhizophydium stewartii]|uniref:Ribosome-binding factor A n=1 Tax=Polyrhizophydium stewartii TaxID=2732419 RepID=A0ABR4N7D1_9FUNG|nr:hypothetical protein HK105_004381 [Polyrhizophydium stewartii]